MNINQNPADVQNNMVNNNVNPAPQQGFINAANPYINQNPASIQTNPYVNGQAANPVQGNADANANSGINSGDFIKGALIGAGVAFLLTNKTTQKAIFNGFSKGSELVQAGIEELKERMEDAKAQMEAKEF